MPNENAGQIVDHAKYGVGRTYNIKGTIDGKVAVYFASKTDDFGMPLEFKTVGILCDPTNLTAIGFID